MLNDEVEDHQVMRVVFEGVDSLDDDSSSQSSTGSQRRVVQSDDTFDQAEFVRIRDSRERCRVASLYELALRRITHPTFYRKTSRPYQHLPQALQDDVARRLLAESTGNNMRMYTAMLGLNKMVVDLESRPLSRRHTDTLISLLKQYGKETPRELLLTTTKQASLTLGDITQLLSHLSKLEVLELHGVRAVDNLLQAVPSSVQKLVINSSTRRLVLPRPQSRVSHLFGFSNIFDPALPQLSTHALLTLMERCPQLTWIEAPQSELRDYSVLSQLLDARPHLTYLNFYHNLVFTTFTQFSAKHRNAPLKLQKYIAFDNDVDKLNISTLMPDLKYLKLSRNSCIDNYLALKNVEELIIGSDTRCSNPHSSDLFENLGKNLVKLECYGLQECNGFSLFYIGKYCPQLVSLIYRGSNIAAQGEGTFTHDPDMDLILFNMYNEGIIPQYFRKLESVIVTESMKNKKSQIKLPLLVSMLTAPNLKTLQFQQIDIQSALESSLSLAESDELVFASLKTITLRECQFRLWDAARWVAATPSLKKCILNNNGEYHFHNLQQFLTTNLTGVTFETSMTHIAITLSNATH